MKKNEQDEYDIVSELLSRVETKGDLPIFNASLNNVRRISSNPESHVMELAQTVMKDSNLSIKLLKIANSPFYSRGPAKISSVSRAVVVLGFDVIKSLCLTLKLIEGFNDEHPIIGMHKMVSRSYLTASFVREIALKCNIKNAEETYVSGLCHSIGEIAVGYFMPERFEDIIRIRNEANTSWEQAQIQALNMTLAQIGQRLAKEWNFSDKVIKSMTMYKPAQEGPVRTHNQLNHAIVSLSSQVMDSIYLKDKRSSKPLRELFLQLETASGIKADKLEYALAESFSHSCELIKSYGLSPLVLQPEFSDSKDGLRDKLTRDFSFIASSQSEGVLTNATESFTSADRTTSNVIGIASNHSQKIPPKIIDTAGTSKTQSACDNDTTPSTVLQRGDPMAQLNYIQEITTLVTEGAPLTTLFSKILQGLKSGVGFDRVALSLVSPDRKLYATRISLGDEEGLLTQTLRGKTDPQHDIFARIIDESSDLLIENLHDGTWNDLLSYDFINASTTNSLIVAGLKRGPKAIGLFYADNALTKAPITPTMRRGFLQFIAQSRLAVQILN